MSNMEDNLYWCSTCQDYTHNHWGDNNILCGCILCDICNSITDGKKNLGFELGKFEVLSWSEWRDILSFKTMGWTNFTPIKLDFEYAPYKETYEMNIALLGFFVCFSWFYGIPFKDKESPNE